jgi:F-type H+-transporting ATPase subunit b
MLYPAFRSAAALALAFTLVLACAPRAAAQDHGAPPTASPVGAEHTAPQEEHAAGAAHEPNPIPSIKEGLVVGIASLVVFGLVFAILSAKVWPLINKGLADRAEKIRSEIEAAELAQQQAKAALDEYEKSLADARAEAQKMLAEAMAQQQAIAADLKAKSEIELTAMRDRARRDIEAAKRAALAEIYQEVSGFTASIAAKILKREITSGDQQRLVEESLAELQSMSRA